MSEAISFPSKPVRVHSRICSLEYVNQYEAELLAQSGIRVLSSMYGRMAFVPQGMTLNRSGGGAA